MKKTFRNVIIFALALCFVSAALSLCACKKLRRRSKPTIAPIPRFLPITHPSRLRRMAALLFTKAKEQSKIQPS